MVRGAHPTRGLGLVGCAPRTFYDWPYSTFHRWVKQGTYNQQWGCKVTEMFDFADLEGLVGE